jgi:hypothetical protein
MSKIESNINGNSKNKCCVLFGWAGASLRYVKSYEKIYQEKGFTTISTIADPKAIMIGL